MYRHNDSDLNYLLFPEEWGETGEFNNTINLGLLHQFKPGAGQAHSQLELNARISASSFYNYQYLEAAYIGSRILGKFDLRSRVYGRFGFGDNLATESALYFAGANPEEMMENKYVRSAGFYPNDWSQSFGATTNHFHYGGGMNMRGYAGYFLVEEDNAGIPTLAYRGRSGGAVNLELGFNRLVKIKKLPKLKQALDFDTYLFGDAGAILYENTETNQQLSTVRLDAGVGMALTIKKFGRLYDIKPLTLRFDVPFYLSHAPATEENVQFRWLIGINKAF
jgi:aminopeptidase N